MTWNKDEIISLLLEAGEVATRLRRGIGWEFKADRSLVTAADKQIEDLFTARLENPGAGTYLIGEETVAEKGEDYLREALREEAYIVDPIDGTVPYAFQLPNWGISVGRTVGGTLVDGAVYLPLFGEMVLSDGDAVLEGVLIDGEWRWRELGDAEPDGDGARLVAVTQGLAKRGRIDVPHTVMALGSAVVPLVGLLQQRFVGYLGNVKLWDAAGALPLLIKKGFSVSISPGGKRHSVTGEVNKQTFDLDPRSDRRWKFLADLLICHPDDEQLFRDGLTRKR